jgi:hypothetical protein
MISEVIDPRRLNIHAHTGVIRAAAEPIRWLACLIFPQRAQCVLLALHDNDGNITV